MRKAPVWIAVHALLCLAACRADGPAYEQIDTDVRTVVLPNFPHASHFEVLSAIGTADPRLAQYGAQIYGSGDTVEVVLSYSRADEGPWELDGWREAELAPADGELGDVIPWLAAAAVLVIAAGYLFMRRRAKPHHLTGVRREALGELIEAFRLRAGEGSLLFILAEGRGDFFQFTKLAAPDAVPALEFVFPETPRTEVFYAQMKRLFASEGWPYFERESAVAGVARFLCVAPVKGSEEAVQLVSGALDVVGAGWDQTFRLSFEAPLSRAQWKARVEQFDQMARSTY